MSNSANGDARRRRHQPFALSGLDRCVEVLPQLYERVLIPSPVRHELLDRGGPDQTRRWAIQVLVWAEIVEPDPRFLDEPDWSGLDWGERGALAIAAVRKPIFLVMDEYAGRLAAQRRGFPITGTLGVLDAAARRHLNSFADAWAKLKQTSFRYPRRLVEQLLREHSIG